VGMSVSTAIIGQRHGVIRQEPEVVAVVRRQAVHPFGDLVLLSDASGAAEQPVRVYSGRDDQSVTGPSRQMRVQGGDRVFGPAGKSEIEERDVTGFALRQARTEPLAAASSARAAATSPSRASICALPAWAMAKPGSAARARSYASAAPG